MDDLSELLTFVDKNKNKATYQYPNIANDAKTISSYKGIPFLPIDDWINTEDWQTMYNEANSLSSHYVPHNQAATFDKDKVYNIKGWHSLCLRGLSSVHTEKPSTYGYTDDTAPYRWTDIADFCPTIVNFLKNKFDYAKFYRLRIMKLDPGGYLFPHRDTDLEENNHIKQINLVINNPDGCDFCIDNIGRLDTKPGKMFKMNLFYKHAVYNNSDQPRYHMILHGIPGRSWQERIVRNYLNNK